MGQYLNRWFNNIEKVESETEAWEQAQNNKNAKINWQFNSDDARIKIKRFYTTLQS